MGWGGKAENERNNKIINRIEVKKEGVDNFFKNDMFGGNYTPICTVLCQNITVVNILEYWEHPQLNNDIFFLFAASLQSLSYKN